MNKRLNLQYCTSDLVLNTIYTEPLLMQYTISLAYSDSNISAGFYAGTMTQQTKPQPKFHTAV
jgi:hypothetical protein